MRLLLDTHILIWLATEPSRLLPRERSALAGSSERVVSFVSLWEIRAKVRAERRRGRPLLRLDPAGAVAFCATTRIGVEGVAVADLTSEPLQVDPPHWDMFDEMLLVHARRLEAKLLTRDPELLGHALAY